MRERSVKLLLLLASILIVEVALRAWDPIGLAHFREVRAYADALAFGEAWGYLHKPGYRARLQGVDVVINSHGLRSPETPLTKPAGTHRLLVLGDSAVFGWGAPQDSIFPARLERALDRADTPVDVIAAGVGSWNTRTEYEWLRARGMAFEPDVVVLLIVGNDADPKDVGRTDVPRDSLLAYMPESKKPARLRAAWQRAYRASFILAHVQYARVAFRQQRQETAGYPLDSPAWRDARTALDGIVDLCAHNRVALTVFLYGDEARVAQGSVLRAYRDRLRAHGIVAHTLPSVLSNERRYHNSFVDGHENSAGHAVLASEIGRVIAATMRGEAR